MAKATCSASDCTKQSVSRGLCSNHYQRWRATNPDAPRCSSPTCDRAAITKGFCEGHYTRFRLGLPTDTPLNRRRNGGGGSARDSSGRRHCMDCERWLIANDFARGTSADGLSPRCRKCRSGYRLSKYGVTQQWYDETLRRQGGKCGICGGESGARVFSIDHDHNCCPGTAESCGKCVRGLLCGRCNTAIGLLKENPETIRAALRYIEKHQ